MSPTTYTPDAPLASARAATAVVQAIAERVRDRLRADEADPLRHPDRVHQVAVSEVRRHNDFALARGLEFVDDEAAAVRDVLARVTGYGPLQALLDDPEVEEIWINGPGAVFAARAGRSERVLMSISDEAVRDLVEKMLHATGRRVDLSQPFVDASLPDGSRLHVVIPDITRSHLAVNIRKFLPARRTLDDLVGAGALPAQVADMLRDAMVEGRNVLVSGATHAGKTTMLAALIGACRPEQRIITVEETFELAVTAPDVVALQGRQPSLEGTNRYCCIGCHASRSQWRPGFWCKSASRTMASGLLRNLSERAGGQSRPDRISRRVKKTPDGLPNRLIRSGALGQRRHTV